MFELVFDRFFFRAVEVRRAARGFARRKRAGLEELSEEELDELRAQIAAALATGGGRDADLARMAIAASRADRRARA